MSGDSPAASAIVASWDAQVLPNGGGSSWREPSTNGRVVYAVGDVHGCYDLLRALLEAIVADAATLDERVRPLLVFCGDYVDRGSRSSEVLDTMVWLSRQRTIEVVFLKGNHEAMLLSFLDGPERCLAWLREDGHSTLRAYGVGLGEAAGIAEADTRRLRDELADRMPVSHLRFLENLSALFTCGGYAFVHAGLRPGVPLARQTEEDCLWIREDFLTGGHGFEQVVVHGHTWSSDRPEAGDQRIGIDTGAYATGVLTAVRLEGGSVRFLQARDGTAASARSDGGASVLEQEGR